MNFKALNKSELTKVSAGGNGSNDGGGTAPAQPLSTNGGGGDGVEPPKSMQTLTRAEMAKVAGGNGGGGDGVIPPKAEARNGGGGDGIQPPKFESYSVDGQRNGGGGGGVIPPAP